MDRLCQPAFSRALLGCLALLAAPPSMATEAPDSGVFAQPSATTAAQPSPLGNRALTYADLVDMALAGKVVAKAIVRDSTRLKPEQSGDVQAGFARLYIEAQTSALLVGPALGESLRFLADIPLDEKGKVPKIKKSQVLLVGNIVTTRPGELLLVASDAMLPWSPALEDRFRAILTELVSPDAPPRITALREALHVPGNLTGEGETQFFLTTDSGKPVSISVLRRPGEPMRWGVSFSEIVDQSAEPPHPDTLAWYRLACSLPQDLPEKANISTTALDRRAAVEDYAAVIAALGTCARNRPHH